MNLSEFWKKASKELHDLPVKVALVFIAAYRVIFSPWMGGSCRFYPSCSEYSRQALNEYGFLKGFSLSIKRLGKCHPLGSHGFDPVPSKSTNKRGDACGA